MFAESEYNPDAAWQPALFVAVIEEGDVVVVSTRDKAHKWTVPCDGVVKALHE